jgi:hypothetical protein
MRRVGGLGIASLNLWDLFGVFMFDLVSFAFAIHAYSRSTALMYSPSYASRSVRDRSEPIESV